MIPSLTPDLHIARTFVESHPPPGRIVLCAVTGAHLYGFSSPDSDLDLKGFHRAPALSLLGMHPRIAAHDLTRQWQGIACDLTSQEIAQALRLLLDGSGNMLERIFSPYQLYPSALVTELQHHAARSLSKRCYRHYRGFFRGVCAEHQRAPAAKSLLYAYRVALTGVHLLRTGEVVADVKRLAREYGFTAIEALIQLKMSTTEETTVPESLDQEHRQVWPQLEAALETAHQTSTLPEAPSHAEELEHWLVSLRLQELA